MTSSQKHTWFVSHPSGGTRHTPTFFNALNAFVQEHPDISVVFPHDKEEEVQLTKDELTKADLILVEVSLSSTGSGIELGWANAADKQIIAFHQGGSDPSPAVKFVTDAVHVYVTEEHITDVLKTLL